MSEAIATLAIDTSLRACSVAIASTPDDVVARSLDIGVGHAEHLAPLAADMLEEANLAPKAIEQIIVTVGPGSFMGVRVGISFAKGFAMAHGAALIPITSLEALWLNAPENASGYTLIDAKRGQVYVQGFGAMATPPSLLSYEAAKVLTTDDDLTLIGSGVTILHPERDDPSTHLPDVTKLLMAAEGKPSGPLEPVYLRAPDAAPAKPIKAS